MLKKLHENLDNLSLSELQNLAEELDVFLFKEVRIGEPWSPLYKKNRKAYKTLLKATIRLRNNLRTFFKGQVERIPQLINLNAFKFDNAEDYIYIESWEKEDDILTATINIDLEALFDIGVIATELELVREVDISSKSTPAAKFLRSYTLDLVRDLNLVTRKRIVEQIRTSIDAGETRSQLVDRLTKGKRPLIDDPKRATMIAQTESVRAYSEGRYRVLEELGYTKKIWVGPQADDKLCPNGEIVDLKANFSNGKAFPPGHPNCRCGFRQADTLSKDDIDSIKNYAK